MSNSLFPGLAWKNIKSNGKFYFPYILTIAGASAAFYITCALANANDVPDMTRYAYLSSYMSIGIFVIGLFSIIFLFYTNSFLMKRRNKEIGLYNILGMGKIHIGRVLCYETLYTALFGIGGGLIGGMLLQKLVTLVALKMIGTDDAPYGFYISIFGIIATVVFFSVILILNLLFNLNRIRISKPAELLRDSSTGEREPKTKWALAIIGVLSLGAGYYIAVSTESALEAVAIYFVAVFLVIIGTYCLFMAGSIVVLKLLRKNKKFYYKAKHFIGVSGMLYRMKRNAVGLANICIILTMVLVMVSGTLALYIGTEDSLNAKCPADISIEMRYDPYDEKPIDRNAFIGGVGNVITSGGIPIKSQKNIRWLNFAVLYKDGIFITDTSQRGTSSRATDLVFITAADYAEFSGNPAPSLSKGEMLMYTEGNRKLDYLSIDFSNEHNPDGDTVTYNITGTPDKFTQFSDFSVYLSETLYFIVPDEETLGELFNYQKFAYADFSYMRCQWFINVDCNDEQQKECTKRIDNSFDSFDEKYNCGHYEWLTITSRAQEADELYSVNGGFFFLGVFLGLIFTMAMVLIIYYKQITEGYEDRERFRIMEQVGLDKKTVRKSVNAQLLTVFFLPLLAAAVHIVFNFKLMKLLLCLFKLYSVSYILISTFITVGLFVVIYGAVYLLTARTYYKIVS